MNGLAVIFLAFTCGFARGCENLDWGCQQEAYPSSCSSFPEGVDSGCSSYGNVAVDDCSYNGAPLGWESSPCVSEPICSTLPIQSRELVVDRPAPVIAQSGCLQNGRSYLEGSINCGPAPQPTPIKYLSPVYLKPQVEPIRVLPSPPLPAPVVISNKCRCTKVVQKPQLYQRLIVAQKNQRFLKKTYVPRTEKVEYCAKPRC